MPNLSKKANLLPFYAGIEYHKDFQKDFYKMPLKVQNKFIDETLPLFVENKFDASLRFHALKRKLTGYFSINVTGDVRVILKITHNHKFILIGTHSQLYG